MEYAEVLRKIGEIKANRKYDAAMHGSMMPTGQVYDYEVLSIIFDLPQTFTSSDLDEEMEKVYESKFKRK